MKTITFLRGGAGKALAGVCTLLATGLAVPGQAQTFELVSPAAPGLGPPASGGGDSGVMALSPDGRYVLFASTANNLAFSLLNTPMPARFPAPLNAFVRDRTSSNTTLVSVDVSGTAGGDGNSFPLSISTNGQYVLFVSSAGNLAARDTNNASDVFVRDLVNQRTLLVSVGTNGVAGNGPSRDPVMTPDGRYVAFVSGANNLVPYDANRMDDVFMRDLQAQTTLLVSVGAVATNLAAPSGSSEAPEITPDGRYVAFFSSATGLKPGVPRGGDVYVRDIVGGTTLRASSYARIAVPSNTVYAFNHDLSADGQVVAYEAAAPGANQGVLFRYHAGSGQTEVVHPNAAVPGGAYPEARSLALTPDGRYLAFIANTNGTTGMNTCVLRWDGSNGVTTLASGDLLGLVQSSTICDWPAISADGCYVAFLSSEPGLTTNALVGDYHIYVRDITAATTVLVNTDTNGAALSLGSVSPPRLSGNGRVVAFDSPDAALVPRDRNRFRDVFARDLDSGATELISARDPALPSLSGNGLSVLGPNCISSNGNWVAFASEAEDLVTNDTNGCRDVFARDLVSGATLLVSVATNGYSGAGASGEPAISPDGRYVAFSSRAKDLVPGQTNKVQDVFLRDLQSGTTTLVSINTDGTGPGVGSSSSPAVSAGGRFVLFKSKPKNPPNSDTPDNLFLCDMLAGHTYTLTTNRSNGAMMTPDGRYVAFLDGAPFEPLTLGKLYVWDSLATAMLYRGAAGVGIDVVISPTGNRIAYRTRSTPNSLYGFNQPANTNWLMASLTAVTSMPRFSADDALAVFAGSSGQSNAVYLYDFQAQTSLVIRQSTNSADTFDFADISSDGRLIAYRSAAADFVRDANGVPDVFLYDRLTGTTTLLTADRFGPASADNRSFAPEFSADGQSLLLGSWASDLVSNDFNQSADLVVFRLYPSTALVPFTATFVNGSTPGRGPWLAWPVLPGKGYRVQYRDNLQEAVWHDLANGASIVGNVGFLTDAAAPATHRFYRIVAF